MAAIAVSTARVPDIGESCFCGLLRSVRSASAKRSRFASTRRPNNDSNAGVNVIATRTATITTKPATVPMSPRNGMPVRFSASSAMTAVEPAKTTALSDVALAMPIEWPDAIPDFSCVRCRWTMNSA